MIPAFHDYSLEPKITKCGDLLYIYILLRHFEKIQNLNVLIQEYMPYELFELKFNPPERVSIWFQTRQSNSAQVRIHAICSCNERWDFPTDGSSLFLPRFSLLTFLRFLGPFFIYFPKLSLRAFLDILLYFLLWFFISRNLFFWTEKLFPENSFLAVL